MTILDLAFDQGDYLATCEGRVYRLVRLICVRSPDGPAMPYCLADAWEETTPALLAKKDAEIELLKGRILELERRQSAPPSDGGCGCRRAALPVSAL